MSLKLGNTDINKLHLGATEIKKAYLGSTLVFDNSAPIVFNTVIGGQGVTTTTAGALETLLGLSGGDVSVFNLIGNDIYAMIDVSYILLDSTFQTNTDITSYLDNDDLVVEVETECFRNATNLNDVLLLGVLTYGTQALRNTAITEITSNATFIASNFVRDCSVLVTFDARFTTDRLGNTFGADNVFLNCSSLATVNCSVVLQTNNGGGRDGDIVYAEDTLGATINYF